MKIWTLHYPRIFSFEEIHALKTEITIVYNNQYKKEMSDEWIARLLKQLAYTQTKKIKGLQLRPVIQIKDEIYLAAHTKHGYYQLLVEKSEVELKTQLNSHITEWLNIN